MPRSPRTPRRSLTLVDVKPALTADFTDSESQRVLLVASRAVARELGRQAAREYFDRLIRKAKRSAPR